MKIKITEIHPESIWTNFKDRVFGKVFEVDGKIEGYKHEKGWFIAHFIPTQYSRVTFIGGFKYIEVPEDQSSMSELAGWIEENKPAKLPQKLTWLQKVRGYDYLKARCEAAESMRDHYKSLMTEALRDRDLHAKVADNWQQRLICVQKDYADFQEMIGRRLKFSVGHNHITIIVGNPVTYIQNFNITTEDKFGDTDWSVSVCSPKDIYNWKIGVIKALDNLCENYSKDLRRDLRKAMAKKYPEVFIA